jgi:hypothetical protein
LEPKFVSVVVVPARTVGAATTVASRQANPIVNSAQYPQVVFMSLLKGFHDGEPFKKSVQVPHSPFHQ